MYFILLLLYTVFGSNQMHYDPTDIPTTSSLALLREQLFLLIENNLELLMSFSDEPDKSKVDNQTINIIMDYMIAGYPDQSDVALITLEREKERLNAIIDAAEPVSEEIMEALTTNREQMQSIESGPTLPMIKENIQKIKYMVSRINDLEASRTEIAKKSVFIQYQMDPDIDALLTQIDSELADKYQIWQNKTHQIWQSNKEFFNKFAQFDWNQIENITLKILPFLNNVIEEGLNQTEIIKEVKEMFGRTKVYIDYMVGILKNPKHSHQIRGHNPLLFHWKLVKFQCDVFYRLYKNHVISEEKYNFVVDEAQTSGKDFFALLQNSDFPELLVLEPIMLGINTTIRHPFFVPIGKMNVMVEVYQSYVSYFDEQEKIKVAYPELLPLYEMCEKLEEIYGSIRPFQGPVISSFQNDEDIYNELESIRVKKDEMIDLRAYINRENDAINNAIHGNNTDDLNEHIENIKNVIDHHNQANAK